MKIDPVCWSGTERTNKSPWDVGDGRQVGDELSSELGTFKGPDPRMVMHTTVLEVN